MITVLQILNFDVIQYILRHDKMLRVDKLVHKIS